MYGENVVEGFAGVGINCDLAYRDFISMYNRLGGEAVFKKGK